MSFPPVTIMGKMCKFAHLCLAPLKLRLYNTRKLRNFNLTMQFLFLRPVYLLSPAANFLEVVDCYFDETVSLALRRFHGSVN